MKERWKAGDWAVYRKSKQSSSPGPRAAKVVATLKGETYSYVVDKFWIVENVLPGNRLELRTARGKTHLINADDPSLRKPTWLHRLYWRNRFRVVEKRPETPNFVT